MLLGLNGISIIRTIWLIDRLELSKLATAIAARTFHKFFVWKIEHA